MSVARRTLLVSALATALGCSLIYETSPLTEGHDDRPSAGATTGGAGLGGALPTAGMSSGAGTGGSTTAGGSSGTSSGGTPASDGGAAGAAIETGGAGAPLLDCSSSWYPDADGDGYGDDSSPGQDCETPGYVTVGGDCDDGDYFRNPGLSDVCDGIDNDCNASSADVCPLDCEWDKSFEDRLYLFCWSPMQTWTDASTICESQLMRMVRIDSSAEQDYVWAWFQPDHAWLGGTDVESYGTWKWQDGEVFWDGTPKLYEDWGDTEPNNMSGNAHCLILDGIANYWNDYECPVARPFACERY